MKKLLYYTALCAVFASSEAFASGFNLKEQSAAAQGNAFAGATAGAEDITYSYFNPAGLTRHSGTKMAVGGTWIAPRSKAKTASSDNPVVGHSETGYTGNIVHAAVSPNFYVSHQINNKWTAGFSLNTPFGMITTYDDDWAGRFHGTKSDVKTLTATPMLAYRPFCKLSLGAGVQVQYVRAKLSNAQITMNGMMPQEDHTKLYGDALDVGWSVMAEFGRTYWSSFEELRILGQNGINSVTQEKWKDTTFYAIGASYRYNDKWKFRAGFAVDQGAVGEYYRTPRIPDADRLWYAGGIEYALNDNTTLNLGYTYIRAEKGRVKLDGTHEGDALRGSMQAKYENDIHIFALGINYNF